MYVAQMQEGTRKAMPLKFVISLKTYTLEEQLVLISTITKETGKKPTTLFPGAIS